MRVLLVSHYFPPEVGAPQARLSDMARLWASDGEEVTVLTGMPNHPTGEIPLEYRGAFRRVEYLDGYRIVRTWLFATPNEGFTKKILGHLSFMVTSLFLGWTGPADVVVVSSPTFFSILSAWILARAKRARFVVEVRDLWPAILVELGVLRSQVAARVLESIEMASYRAADAVVVVTDGFRQDLVRRGVSKDKVHVVRNGADIEWVGNRPTEDVVRRGRSWLEVAEDETLVLYLGAHGISHGLNTIIDVAAEMTGERVHFSFVGEGAAKSELRARISARKLSNVSLLPGVPHSEVPELLAAADICLVPLRNIPLFSSFIPSKIFEYFAAGKAVIGSVSGEAATILDSGGAVVVAPEDREALTDAIRSLAGDPDRRRAMGLRARGYVRKHFDRRLLATAYRQILVDVVNASESRAGADTSERPR